MTLEITYILDPDPTDPITGLAIKDSNGDQIPLLCMQDTSLNIEFPMRFDEYHDSSSTYGTRESMIQSDFLVYIKDCTDPLNCVTFYPITSVKTEGTLDGSDSILATFSGSSTITPIRGRSTIIIYVEGITNPPTTRL